MDNGGPSILDIYGLKTRPVGLSRFMADISMKDLLAGDFTVFQPKRTAAELQNSESRGSLKSVVNGVLWHLPKWAGGDDSVAVSMAINMGEKEHCSSSVLELRPNMKRKDSTGISEAHDTMEEESLDDSFFQTDLKNKIAEKEELRDFEATKLECAMNHSKGFSVDALPLHSFEDCLKSLKLPPCGALEDLMSRATLELDVALADSGVVPCLNSNNNIIPPLSSFSPNGTCKMDMGLEKAVMNGKVFQQQWIQGGTVANVSPKEIAKKQSFWEVYPVQEVEGKETRSGSSTVRKLDLEGRSDRLGSYKAECTEVAARPDKFTAFNGPGKFDTCESRKCFSKPTREVSRNMQDKDVVQEAGLNQASVKCGFVKDSTELGLACNQPFPKMKFCCSRCFSHLSSNLSDRPVSPRVVAASSILYHMANCLPFPEDDIVEENPRRRALQSYPGALSQECPKSLKLGHSTDGLGAVATNAKNGRKHNSKSKPTETSTPTGKSLNYERMKSLSQVSDAFGGSSKLSVPKIQRRKGWICSNLQAKLDTRGSQSALKLANSEKGSHNFREDRKIGKGPGSYTSLPCKVLNVGISKGSRNPSTGSNATALPRQKVVSDRKGVGGSKSYKGGGLGRTGGRLRPNVVTVGNSIGTGPVPQHSSTGGTQLNSRKICPKLLDSKQMTKQEVARGRTSRP